MLLIPLAANGIPAALDLRPGVELLVIDHLVEFLPGIINSVSIVGVNNKDDTLGVGVVVSP